MYYFDKGIPVDYVKGYAWTSLASAQGYEQAEKMVRVIFEKMNSEQIVQAKKEAVEMREQIRNKLLGGNRKSLNFSGLYIGCNSIVNVHTLYLRRKDESYSYNYFHCSLLGPSLAICDDFTAEKKAVIKTIIKKTGALQIGKLFCNEVSNQIIELPEM